MPLQSIQEWPRIEKAAFKTKIDRLQIRLKRLQRTAIELEIPVIILFEGWGASGKGTQINRLILDLDPRHFSVHSILMEKEEEAYRPFLWRFWTKMPARGRMAIFDRSWYRRVHVDRVNKTVPKQSWQNAFNEIAQFERTLADDGTTIIKFFLHISEGEQKKRFRRLEADSATAWRVTKMDWRNHKRYEKFVKVSSEMIERTDVPHARWTIVPADQQRYATLKIFETTIASLQGAIRRKRRRMRSDYKPRSVRLRKVTSSRLDKANMNQALSREDYRDMLRPLQDRIRQLEHRVYQERVPVVILYEGWDAAGKGGNIKRLTQRMDPRGYEVIPIAAPNDIEKRHHYLWRFWNHVPKAGHIAIFDRTWYGRVLVERIEGFASEAEWRRAYREINEFEAQLTAARTVLLKFWLHIDQDEQLRRFKERQAIPDKNWKITEEDWRNRDKWDDYYQAVDEMIFRTSKENTPWTVVEANSKLFARIKVLRTTIAAIEAALG